MFLVYTEILIWRNEQFWVLCQELNPKVFKAVLKQQKSPPPNNFLWTPFKRMILYLFGHNIIKFIGVNETEYEWLVTKNKDKNQILDVWNIF